MKNIVALLFAFTVVNIHAQNYEKVVFNKSDSLYGYYLAVRPLSPDIQAVMVLLPGYNSGPETIFPETKLHNVAYMNGILTIAVSTGKKLYADKSVSDGMNKIMNDVMARFAIAKDKFVIGGFSTGGTLALRYTELCYEQASLYPVQPQAVFSVDGPADLVGLYKYFEREIKKNFAKPGVDEAVFVKGILDNEIGPLAGNIQKYISLSPFYMDSDTMGNERFLRSIPVRVYHDVDVVWMLQNRRRSLRDINATASSELINSLILAGNDKAEFMPGKTGYRSDGTRHPHAWSIVDEPELVQWIKRSVATAKANAMQPYNFPTPGWATEKETFPLSFAPTIHYSGAADIRFMPGFGAGNSDEFWSYCYLWYLDGSPVFTDLSLKKDIENYYNGLNESKVTTAMVKSIQPTGGYAQTFECIVTTLDKFVTHKQITLHAIVNVKKCSPANKTIAFFQVSPQAFSSKVWQALNTARDGVYCK